MNSSIKKESLDQTVVERFVFKDFSSSASSTSFDSSSVSDQTETSNVPPESAPIAAPVLTFTEQEIEQLKTEYFNRGKAVGIKEKNTQDEETHQFLLKSLKTQLTELFLQEDSFKTQALPLIKKLSLLIAKKFVGELLEKKPTLYLENIIQQSFSSLFDRSHLTIKVHETILPLLTKELDTLSYNQTFQGQITLEPDNRLSPTDCHIIWHNGIAKYEQETLWQEITNLIHHTPLTLALEDESHAEDAKDSNKTHA